MGHYTFGTKDLYGPEAYYQDEVVQLKKRSMLYYHCGYYGFHCDGNPDYINCLKNTFRNEKPEELAAAKDKVRDIIYEGILCMVSDQKLCDVVVVCAPRAKALDSYAPDQLYFIDAVDEAAEMAHAANSNIMNGTHCIQRYKDTKTTHLKSTTSRVKADGSKENGNSGPDIYDGICLDTCKIDGKLVENRIVILVDDIYTQSAHVDVDMMNALYKNGAEKVFLLTVAKTAKRPEQSPE